MTVAPQRRTTAAHVVLGRGRLDSIDLLRGLVMVVMVLDHTRDFVHAGALHFDPTDLTQTTTALFLTRWITHFCAPVFVFLAGVSAYLRAARGTTTNELSRFLFVRGLWLIVLECTAVRIGAFFNLDYSFVAVLQVIWAIGVSMIVLAGLVYLPVPAIAGVGVAMIVLHNAADGIHVQGWQGPGSPVPGAWATLWILLHQAKEALPLGGPSGPVVFVMYPLVPWIGVMAAGYAFGTIYELDAARRIPILRRLGMACVLAFVCLRTWNVYGDPAPWAPQQTLIASALSFVNVTKYPPSLQFLLLMLGPSFLALAWFEGRGYGRGWLGRQFVMFGRVPLFFYLWQWPLVHLMALVVSLLAGKHVGYLFRNFLDIPASAPPDAGFGLGVVYLCWMAVLALLFLLCRWFAAVKQRRRDWWLAYI